MCQWEYYVTMKEMNYSNITTRSFIWRFYTYSWTSMFRITFRHLFNRFSSFEYLSIMCVNWSSLCVNGSSLCVNRSSLLFVLKIEIDKEWGQSVV